MQKEGKYDENRDLWENGVQLVTANIQNKMLQLLYNENRQSALIYSDMQHITRNMIINKFVPCCFSCCGYHDVNYNYSEKYF